jgi:hypothetical protein
MTLNDLLHQARELLARAPAAGEARIISGDVETFDYDRGVVIVPVKCHRTHIEDAFTDDDDAED